MYFCRKIPWQISSQKRILETYAKQNGFSNLRWYTDDGYSGANFQRPGFQAMLADIEAEQKELKERAARLRKELSKAQEATENAEKFMNVVRRHTTIEELSPTLLREFVEKIFIHERVALDGKRRGKLRRQEIEIYYSFVDKVELPDT